MEMEETKIGRLEHKIEKLKTLGERTPGVEFMRSEVFSGDHGLAVIEHAPFGVIGAITPVTHSLPTITGNAVSMLAGGNTVVVNPHPSGKKVAAEGVRRFNEAIYRDLGIDNLICVIAEPTLESANAIFDHRGVNADLRHRRPGRRPGGAAKSASGPSSPGRAIRRSSSMKRPTSTAPPAAIIQGGAYDNNLLCIAEKEVFVVASVFDEMMAGDGAGRRRAAERPRGRGADQGRDHASRRRRAQARRRRARTSSARTRPCWPRAPARTSPTKTELLFGETDETQPVRARRADDAVRAVRPLPRRRRGDRPGEGSRARLPAHEHHPLEQRAKHDQDGPRSWTRRCS